ncbi:hypothetical protein D3C80_2228590 [compost metagenome]
MVTSSEDSDSLLPDFSYEDEDFLSNEASNDFSNADFAFASSDAFRLPSTELVVLLSCQPCS